MYTQNARLWAWGEGGCIWMELVGTGDIRLRAFRFLLRVALVVGALEITRRRQKTICKRRRRGREGFTETETRKDAFQETKMRKTNPPFS